MGELTCNEATVGEIIGIDLTGRPFLHEQGQVVLRGYVQSLDISADQWTLQLRDIEILDKNAGTWSLDEPAETFHGPMDHTTFYRCWDGPTETSEPAVQICCYGSLVHIGLGLEDPWRGNQWPDLDTDFLPADMRSNSTGC
ncbi:MAG: hypothetical protein OER56_10645 [Hyphomicrobiales bacterium]|nr:hypothetical protein [Hyphomicrobiales bacterium]